MTVGISSPRRILRDPPGAPEARTVHISRVPALCAHLRDVPRDAADARATT